MQGDDFHEKEIEMLFIDDLLKSDKVSQETKKRLDGIVVISADNVSEYYYAGTDKEYWYSSDFPNIAPVFPHFWMDFKAPSKMVSIKTGTKPWTNELPSMWGLEVTAHSSLPPDSIHTKDGRERMLTDMSMDVYRMFNSVNISMPNFMQYYDMDYVEAKKHLTSGELHMLYQLKDMTDLYKLMVSNKWSDVAELWSKQMDGIKWIVEYRFYQKIQDVIFDNCWLWKVSVANNGETAMFKDTDQSLMLSSPLNTMNDILNNMVARRGIPFNDATDRMKKSFMPFLECTMLAISFMHCKNVTLDDVNPKKKIIRNKAAKRRGDKGYQSIQHKVLNIKPMRQVLKTEGKEDSEGTSQAMHICRGHFKHYAEGRGLFGKLHGTYWWSDNVRGNSKRGVVDKNYNIDLQQILDQVK
jgi:hypothetical protein